MTIRVAGMGYSGGVAISTLRARDSEENVMGKLDVEGWGFDAFPIKGFDYGLQA